jgi:hypothetical protein
LARPTSAIDFEFGYKKHEAVDVGLWRELAQRGHGDYLVQRKRSGR